MFDEADRLTDRWEEDMDELQSEDWEWHCGGPEDEAFEYQEDDEFDDEM